MSTKYALLLACLLSGVTVPAMAQETTADAAQPKSNIIARKIVLNKDPLLSPKELPGKISGIEVVCATWDTAHLGFMQVGMANRRAAAVPDKNMSTYLSEFVEGAFSHLYTPDGMKLLWVVEDLRVGERTGAMSEKAYIRLKATAYGSTDGHLYKKLSAIDEVKATGGMDVTHKHKINIANAFKGLLQKTPDTTDSTFTKEAILQHQQQKRQLPALAATQMKDGVYIGFADFRENTPTISNFKIQQTSESLELVEVTPEGKEVPVNICWGVVKDGNAFRFLEGKLIPIEKYHYGYILSSYVDDSRKRNNAMMWGSMMGGMAGTLIAGGATTLLSADAFPSLRPKPEATAIDMETGAFIF